MMDNRNLSMLVDFYELTMGNGFLENGCGQQIAYFDMFYRKAPDNAAYAISAGLEQVIQYIKNLSFSEEDIEYLRSKKLFNEPFLEYLRNFKFTCDVWAIPEGTPIFPHEPIVTVRGEAMQAQLLETMILLTINHQSLIATKANRIVTAAQGRPVMEFGSRRAQGYDGAVYGARAAYIGGVAGTACAIADRAFQIPALGTMAHSWVQLYDTELDAFRAYAKVYPDDCTLLIDTYNVLHSGLPNAITVFKELEANGHKGKGVRIDSGDIAYLSKRCRQMLDNAGLNDVGIVASNSLDEYIIRDLIMQGAQITSFGVGERLVTSKSEPVFGGVYKLSAIEKEGKIIPKIKISENIIKVTNPSFKTTWRLFDRESGKALADVMTLYNEEIDDTKPYEIFDPVHTYKRKTLTNFTAKKLQVPIFVGGECVYESPTLPEIQQYCKEQLETIWEETKRFENPQPYFVDLSQKLWDLKHEMLQMKFSK